MAKTKKETDENLVVTEAETAEDKNVRLEKELEELKAQMALLIKANAKDDVVVPKKKEKEKNITFINLTNGKVCLKGTKQWEIVGQFSKKNFLEREARVIVNNMANAIAEGIVYIADADFVEENDLSAVYANLLTDKQIKDLLNHDASYVIDAYKNASESQKDIIIGMITDQKLNGKDVDYNVLVKLGKLCGRDLVGIEEKNDKD